MSVTSPLIKKQEEGYLMHYFSSFLFQKLNFQRFHYHLIIFIQISIIIYTTRSNRTGYTVIETYPPIIGTRSLLLIFTTENRSIILKRA